MGGTLRRYARDEGGEDQERLEVHLPSGLLSRFQKYVEHLHLNMDEALQHLIEAELSESAVPPSRPELYRVFWSDLIARLEVSRTPLAQSWYTFSSGHKGISYTLSFTKEGKTRIDLYVDVGDKAANRRIFDLLKSMRADIDRRFPRPLSWETSATRRACKIGLDRSGRVTDDNREELMAWLIRGLALFREVFESRLQRVE